MATLTFDDAFVIPIVDGEKTATVRQDRLELDVGKVVEAVTPDETHFATLKVTRTATCKAVEALSIIEVCGGRYGASRVDELLDSLNGYYESPIRTSTYVDVVVFSVEEAFVDVVA